MRYEIFIGLRYLKARTGLLFSVGGVAVGIATVVVALSVMNGWESMIRDKMLRSEGHIFVSGNLNAYRTMMEEIESVDGAEAAAPVLVKYTALMDEGANQQVGAMLKAIDPDLQADVTGIGDFVSEKLSFDSPLIEQVRSTTEDTINGGIILGKGLAVKLRATKGDIVRLIAKLVQTPGGYVPIMKAFVVVDIYDSGMYSYDSVLAFIPLEVGQEIYDMMEAINWIEVKVDDIYKVEEIRDEIQMKLGLFVDTMTWMERHKTLFEAVKLEKLVTFIIEALIIFVATFNIASTLIMMVLEKTREVGILKSMGATKRNIWFIFTFEGILIGVVGAILGTLLGIFLCWSLETWLPITIPSPVYQIDRLPAEISWPFVGAVNIAALLLCLLSTLYPAWRASRLKPVEALRYE